METKQGLNISSPAFEHGGNIPSKFTCEGEDINPELTIDAYPANTMSLVLIVDDPDAPGRTFDHWIVWNIEPQRKIKEDSAPGETGVNSLGENAYTGPCPPSGVHRYFFKVYALDTMLDLKSSSDKKTVEKAIEGHVVAYGELVGKYIKQRK
ncbi:MAG TPA: YbhB/YbcL family Raf kinase inhibitor-like protein [Chryseosolibacter sp.]